MLKFFQWCFIRVFLVSAACGEAPSLNEESLSALESRLAKTEQTLAQLSHLNLRSGVGSQGFRTQQFLNQEHEVNVKIDLGEPQVIDLLVLVPAIWRSSSNQLVADGFPIKFSIVGGLESSQAEYTLVEHEFEEGAALKQLSPLVFSIEPKKLSWLRLEVRRHSIRPFDESPVLQLAEFLAFSGAWNVALGSEVTANIPLESGGGWAPEFLVDGSLPYMLDSASDKGSVAYASVPFGAKTGGEPWPYIALDLGEPYQISRINLHVMEQNDTVPQAYSGNFGIPDQFRIYGSHDPTFTEKKLLVSSLKKLSAYEVAPILGYKFPETQCRYIRLVAERPQEMREEDWNAFCMGFAEIECFEGELNVAIGGKVATNVFQENKVRNPAALSDGKNLYGEVLPQRVWLKELALRHDLEKEKLLLEAAIADSYLRQRGRLQWMTWLVFVLAAGLVLVYLFGRAVHKRNIAEIRERHAADLHDEIGANVHAISLLTDVANASRDDGEKLEMLHGKMRRLARRTGVVIANWGDIVNAQGLYNTLVEDMKRAAKNIVGNLEHDFVVQGESDILKLKPQMQVDLYLFYKECLINIARHADATSFSSELIVSPNQIELVIRDNGKGMANFSKGTPKSLSRRAGLLKADLEVKTDSEKGVSIFLKLNPKKHFV